MGAKLLLQKVTAGFIAYLYNSVFPPLLSEAEERDCIAKMAEGDEEARNKLIEHNLRLVAHICKKFENTGVDKDDLISIGTIGLIKGINTFSPDKGAKLATYAARCIENAILSPLLFVSFTDISRAGSCFGRTCWRVVATRQW